MALLKHCLHQHIAAWFLLRRCAARQGRGGAVSKRCAHLKQEPCRL